MYKVLLFTMKYHEMFVLWIFLLEILIPECFAILNGGKFCKLIISRNIYLPVFFFKSLKSIQKVVNIKRTRDL